MKTDLVIVFVFWILPDPVWHSFISLVLALEELIFCFFFLFYLFLKLALWFWWRFNAPYLIIEAATRGVLWKKVFLEISRNLQENTCARVSFLIKLQALACSFIKKKTLAQVFSCEFCESSKNAFFIQNISVGCFYHYKIWKKICLFQTFIMLWRNFIYVIDYLIMTFFRPRNLTVTVVRLQCRYCKCLFTELNCRYRPTYSHNLFQKNAFSE